MPVSLARIVDTPRAGMGVLVKTSGFRIRPLQVTEHGVSYRTFQVVGYLHGERVRKKFQTREEALGEKNRLEVAAANAEGQVRAVNTRLSTEQLAEAESAFSRLAGKSLSQAVDWFLRTYRPRLSETGLDDACAAFLAARGPEVRPPVLADYEKTLKRLKRTFPKRSLHTVTTPELEELLKTCGKAKKSWNNQRTYLHSFFEWCLDDRRRWVSINPVSAIVQHRIARGIPTVEHAAKIAALFAFLETYRGGPRSQHRPGYLVPYFALATFAGIRPSVIDGELRKIHELDDRSKVIDAARGVIRITPEIAKTSDLRQVTIQPNLAAWMQRYPLTKFPLMVTNMTEHVAVIRKRFELAADVLRHTFVSAHVAKFKSVGATALESGNSERIIKKHYLNHFTPDEAEAFWAVIPLR